MIKWLNERKDSLRETTYTNYRHYINSYINPGLGHHRLDRLNTDHLKRFYNQMGKKYSRSTVASLHRVIKAALNRAPIKQNPAKLVNPPKIPKPKMRVWSEDEVTQFLEVAKSNRLYIAFLLALTTGMRRGEILGLSWENIDFKNRTIYVEQSLTMLGEIQELKSDSARRPISLPKTTVDELRKHKLTLQHEKSIAGPSYEDSGLVVCTRYGTKVLPRNLNRTWYKLRDKAGVTSIRFHDLRHTHATLMLKQGIHPKIVSERLGHSSIRVTLDTYSHVVPGLQKAAADQFGKMLFGR